MAKLNGQLERIYQDYRQQLFVCAVAVTRCPERAEDAVHDAFCRLTNRPIAAEDLKAYVFRCVRNAAVDQLRRNSGPVGELDDSLFDPTPGPRQQASNREFQAGVSAALANLKNEERETIIEHLWGDLTFREIAEIRGAPLNTVTSWYRRGIGRLREILEE